MNEEERLVSVFRPKKTCSPVVLTTDAKFLFYQLYDPFGGVGKEHSVRTLNAGKIE